MTLVIKQMTSDLDPSAAKSEFEIALNQLHLID